MNIEQHIPLVHSIAHKRYNSFKHKYEYDDLFQVGCIGLMNACDNFDPSRGFKFSTYAYPIIDGAILRLARDDKWFGYNRKERRESNGPLSADYNYGSDIAGDTPKNLLAFMTNEDDSEFNNIEIKMVIDKLPSKYRDIIKMYFFEGYNQADIGKHFGVGQNTISRHMQKALNMLKKELE